MSRPFAQMQTLKRMRYPLLAATILSAIVVPQWAGAFDRSPDGRIVVAQNVDPKDKNKGKQPAPKSNTPQPAPGGQPKQTNNPPPANVQQQQQQKQQQQQQKQQQGQPGNQPGSGQPKTFGKQGPGNQPQPGAGGQQQQQQQGGQQPGGQGQPKTFGKQAPNNQNQPGAGGQQQQQGVGGQQPGGQGQPKTFGKQAPNNQNQQQGIGGQQQQQQGLGVQPGGQPGGQPKTFGKQNPGNPPGGQNQQGGVQTGQQFGNIDQLRSQRQVRTEANGRTVTQEGNRFIVRDGNRTFIRSDDSDRFRRFGNTRVEQRGGERFTILSRGGGVQVINVTDANGNLLRRVRRGPDGREVILIDNRRRGIGPGGVAGIAVGALAVGAVLGLAAPMITIPRNQYIVDMDGAPPTMLYDTLEAPPLVDLERPYTLDEVRYNVELRDRMRRIDINTINFDTGSWTITPDQYDALAGIAQAVSRVLQRHPEEIFLIEGHTDAVGNDDDNLSLSDRRAETVANILAEHFQIPPENLVTQGYGEQFLKVPTQGPSRENRRVALRRVGPLLAGKAN